MLVASAKSKLLDITSAQGSSTQGIMTQSVNSGQNKKSFAKQKTLHYLLLEVISASVSRTVRTVSIVL